MSAKVKTKCILYCISINHFSAKPHAPDQSVSRSLPLLIETYYCPAHSNRKTLCFSLCSILFQLMEVNGLYKSKKAKHLKKNEHKPAKINGNSSNSIFNRSKHLRSYQNTSFSINKYLKFVHISQFSRHLKIR